MFETSPTVQNRAICAKCGKPVPAGHDERAGEVYLVKDCPECGRTETLVSSSAARYREKRALVGYRGEAEKTCSLRCTECNAHRPPALVFMDVTNRCNMNCPICLANIPAMGFRFDPPLEYFDRIFQVLSRMNPRPKIQMFGGEPTVRADLIEIIRLAYRKYDLEVRVVTNGIKLADEAYCKALCDTRAQLMFSFDGRDPAIYAMMRKHPQAYAKKMRALENIRKYRKSKITLMTAVSENTNGPHLADLVQFCHEGRDYIAALDLIPLTAEWGPENIEAKSATIEDVERLMSAAVPGLEFAPVGLFFQINKVYQVFPFGRLTFGGAHPNCESVSILVSDGHAYRPIAHYLKHSLAELMADVIALDREMARTLDGRFLSRLCGRRGRQLLYGLALHRLMRKHLNTRELFGGAATPKVLRIIGGLLLGRKLKDLLRAHTRCHGVLRVIVLPFEEKECVEAARLVDCPASFVYEHPVSREIRFMPVCAWAIYKNDILRATANRYGLAQSTAGQDGLEGLRPRADAESTPAAAAP